MIVLPAVACGILLAFAVAVLVLGIHRCISHLSSREVGGCAMSLPTTAADDWAVPPPGAARYVASPSGRGRGAIPVPSTGGPTVTTGWQGWPR